MNDDIKTKMTQPIDVQLKLYDHLRQEILQAINNQHRTFIAESFFVSVVFSFSVGSVLLNISEKEGNFTSIPIVYLIGTVVAFTIAPAVIFLTSLWLIEQSRMMRAGEFLEHLEDEINKELNSPYLIWENWLRRDNVVFYDIHRLHHYAQGIIIIMFLAMGYLSIYLLNYLRHVYTNLQDFFIGFMILCGILLTILAIIYLWSIFHRHTILKGNYLLSSLHQYRKKDKPDSSSKTGYDDFREKYIKTHGYDKNTGDREGK